MALCPYTPEERKSFVEILKAARKRIARGQNEYICLAIARTLLPNKDRLGAEIMHRLEGCYTVYEWLKKQGVFHDINKPFDYWEPFAREYRLRWLDSLIEEFSRPL